jgi:ABC-type nitrate/sulfonate/bicarbonate transport system ATPase subunit
MTPPRVATHELHKSFGDRLVLDGLEITVADGEFVSIIGPSGCGKSTLFNILAGLEHPDSGGVSVSGEDATGRTEHFAYMPQKDSLLPWRRVLDNASLGLQLQGASKREARAAADQLFPTFGLDGYQRSWPGQLSGGMRQRVALLRTVVQKRTVLLLDEPFGALDSLTRTQMQVWLTEVWERYHWTVVLITHDIREAVFLSDRVYALTPRPARIRAEHVIDLPRPRGPETFTDPRAVAIEGRLLAALGGNPPVPAQEEQ